MNQNITLNQSGFNDPNRLSGSAAIGLISGIVAGAASGIAARIAMRIVALAAGQRLQFSFEGTLFILILGALIGAWLGICFVILSPFLPGSFRRRGFLFGLVPSGLIVVLSLLVKPEGELSLVPQGVIAALFGPLPLVFGVIMGVATARLVANPAAVSIESRSIGRAAGLLAILLALPVGIIELILSIAHPAAINLGFDFTKSLEQALGFFVLGVSFFGISGLLRSGAVGQSTIGQAGFFTALAGFTLLSLVSFGVGLNRIGIHGLIRLISSFESENSWMPLLILIFAGNLGLVIGGLAVLQARRWVGKWGYVPLLLGLLPFLSYALFHPAVFEGFLNLSASNRSELSHWLGALYAVGWFVLGIALRAECRPVLQEQASISTPQPT